MTNGRTLSDATPADAHAFAPPPDARRGGAPGKDPDPASVNVRLAALRSLYDFAGRIGSVEQNPADRVKRPRLPEPAPKGLTPAQVRAIRRQREPTDGDGRTVEERLLVVRRQVVAPGDRVLPTPPGPVSVSNGTGCR